MRALQEAGKSLVKISSNHSSLETLQNSILGVKRFLELQDLVERRDFASVIAGCRNLLSQKEQPPTRHGDVLGLLVESQISLKQYPEALTSLRELTVKCPDWSSREIIDKSLIERLAHESGIDFNQLWNSGRNPLKKQVSIDQSDDEDDEEEIEENLEV